MRPGVNVTTSAVAGIASPGQRLGRWFVAGVTERGPVGVDPSRTFKSLAEFSALYGDRVSYGTLYDAIDAYFRFGGSEVAVSRVVGPAATKATLMLQDRNGAPANTLKVDAKGPGAYGTRLAVQVTDGVAANTFVLAVSFDSVVVEVSPELGSPADAVQWSRNSDYVTITDQASATAAPNNNPKVIASTALAGGSDDRTSITNTEWAAALAAFSSSMGPALVSAPTRTSSAGIVQVIDHAGATNRVALTEGPSGATSSTLTALAGTVRAATASEAYGAMFAPWVTVPGVAPGTTRDVPPSAVAAGLIARQVGSGSANVPAAGANGRAEWALSLGQAEFTDSERAALNTAGVDVFHRPYGSAQVTLYGYKTLDPAGSWGNLNHQLLRCLITEEALLVGEEFMFDQIDGRGLKIAEFNGALRAMLHGHYLNGELFGSTPAEAFRVDTGPGVNTPTTLAANTLKANLSVRMSPFAEQVDIVITKFPITEALAV